MSVPRLPAAVRLVWSAHPAGVLIATVGSCVLGLVPVMSAWLAKLVVDNLAIEPPAERQRLLLLIAGIALTVLIGQVGQGSLRYVEDQLSRRIEIAAQGELFAALNRHAGLTSFERPSVHNQLYLALQAGQQAPFQLISVASGLIQGAFSLAGFVTVLLAINPVLAGLASVAVVPHLIAEMRLSKRDVELSVALSPTERRKLFYARLQSEPQAAKELRIFGLGTFFHRRMLGELNTIWRAERALGRRKLAVQATLDGLSAVATAIGLVLMIRMAVTGRLTAGDVVVVLSALPGMALAAVALVRQLAQGAQALLLIGQYRDLIELAPAREAVGPDAAASPLRAGITLDDVWFRYDDDLPWILRGVSMHIPFRCSVGLVGLNGAGKSTLVKLLCRLYEPTKGRILWGGTDIRELAPASLRARIGAVFQDFMTYDLTAAENIGLGDLASVDDLDRVREVARLAGIHEAIELFPRGYSTMLSRIHGSDNDDQEGGLMPSQGQWQRLALARMLMRMNRDLLILDEPSSGLDAEAEYNVHRLVHGHTGATRILISHRLNAVRMADIIVVLDGGTIVERGTHDELTLLGGRYATLFNKQASGYRD
jgi:ATP-binding cassette, subfamily B, bacterial